MRLSRLVTTFTSSLSDWRPDWKEELDLSELLTDVVAMYRDEFAEKDIRIIDIS
jgi:hypothetical protein